MDSIYVITGITGQLKPNTTIFGDTRPFGWFPSFEIAERIILENKSDINEAGYYRFFVIEEIQSGIHAISNMESWYQWDYDHKAYYAIDKPREFRHIIGWSLG